MKTWFITGVSRGFGREWAIAALERGDRVAATARDVSTLEDLVSKYGDALLPLQLDVDDREADFSAVATAFEHFGRLDVIVNNAGRMIFKPIEAHDESDLLGVMRVDLFGAFWFIKQAFLRCKPGAAIVNVSSIHAVETTPLVAAYAAAKAALVSLTRSAAIEGRPKGIRVNAVLPGAIETPMLRDNPEVKSGVEKLKAGDVGRPEDVARAIAYLASDDAAFVTGAGLRVDGGRLATL